MSRSHEWLQGTGALWNERDRRWTFPSGATLTFGYCETAKDVYRYQGAEFQFIGIDELTQWPEQPYRYLLSRLRRLQGVTVPLRARAGANPGGIGHEWVKRRFLDGGSPECRFVGAKLQDNPHVDATEYRRSLALLTETTRRQLEDGIWVRDSGGLVYRYDEHKNSVDVAPKLDYYVLGIDYGYTDDTAFSVIGWRANDPTVYVVESFKSKGLTPSDAAEVAHALSRRFAPVRIVGDMGGLGKGYAEEARARWSLPIEPADKNNKRGYIELMNGDFERSRIKLVSGMTQPLVKEYAELPWEDDRSAECDGFDNHCFVAGTLVSTARGQVPIESVVKGDLVWTRKGLRAVTTSTHTRIVPTYELRTKAGRTLVGSAEHPVLANGRWVPLAHLTEGDTLSVWAGSRSSVHDHVLRVTPTGKSEQVYNLSVDSVPEYYAGGILVHNCADATLYTWRAACAYHERLPAAPPDERARARAEEAAQIASVEQSLANEHRWWEQ